jgi:hypothetical protein
VQGIAYLCQKKRTTAWQMMDVKPLKDVSDLFLAVMAEKKTFHVLRQFVQTSHGSEAAFELPAVLICCKYDVY